MDEYKANFKADVPDREITATPASALLEKTKAGPDDCNFTGPRCYNDCVPVDGTQTDMKESTNQIDLEE